MHSEEYKQDKLEDTYSDISNDNKIVEKIHEFNVNKKKKTLFNSYLELGIYILLAFAACYLIVTFVGQRTVVDGKSMETTLSDGDNLIVDKLSYRFNDPKRYDIIVFPYHESVKGDVHYIKRIIGLPGETIQISGGKIYIDGEELEDKYGYYYDGKELEPGMAQNPIYINEDEYFVMGDNRNASSDSRVIGCIKKEDITGKAIFRIFPFSNIGSVY